MATSRQSSFRLDAEEKQRALEEDRSRNSLKQRPEEKQVFVKEWVGNVLIGLDGRCWRPQDSSIQNAAHGPNGITRDFILATEMNGRLIEHPGTPHERVWILEKLSEHSMADTGTAERDKIFKLFDEDAPVKKAA